MSHEAYQFCMTQAARQATALGIPVLIAIEFGVAGGRGLLAMEKFATETEAKFPVQWRIYGFDTGTGMPPPRDYRDLPYAWKAGWYAMDQAKLRERLTRAKLVIGPIDETLSLFVVRDGINYLGFVAFDLDYFSSTLSAMEIFRYNIQFLPRTFCYFDDVVGNNDELHCDYVGELAAIRQFNEGGRKICPINGLTAKLGGKAELWHEGVRVLHIFDHPLYCTHIRGPSDTQLGI